MLILVFRIGCIIPVPGLTDNAFSQLSNNGMFRLYDMLSGGAFQQVSLFAMTISPYINASIIVQLLTVAIPALERTGNYTFTDSAECRRKDRRAEKS